MFTISLPITWRRTQYIIVLPGQIPGFKRDDIKVLSSNETKMSVWWEYTATCEASGEQAVSYSKFADLWQQFTLMLSSLNP